MQNLRKLTLPADCRPNYLLINDRYDMREAEAGVYNQDAFWLRRHRFREKVSIWN